MHFIKSADSVLVPDATAQVEQHNIRQVVIMVMAEWCVACFYFFQRERKREYTLYSIQYI